MAGLAVVAGVAGCATTPQRVPVTLPEPTRAAEAASPPANRAELTAEEQRYLDLATARPRDSAPWFQLGNYYAANNRLAGAEFAYRQALKREDSPKSLYNLGLVQLRLGINAINEALRRLPPDDPAQTQARAFLKLLLEEGL